MDKKHHCLMQVWSESLLIMKFNTITKKIYEICFFKAVSPTDHGVWSWSLIYISYNIYNIVFEFYSNFSCLVWKLVFLSSHCSSWETNSSGQDDKPDPRRDWRSPQDLHRILGGTVWRTQSKVWDRRQWDAKGHIKRECCIRSVRNWCSYGYSCC